MVAGRSYEFANDLVQEVLYESTPEPTRLAYHLRAADLLADNPEAMARHARAGGDDRRAARAWLSAGRRAAHRYAMADAEALLNRAIDAAAPGRRRGACSAAAGSPAAGCARPASGSRRRSRTTPSRCATGREIGDRRLEMAALHELGGAAWAGVGPAGGRRASPRSGRGCGSPSSSATAARRRGCSAGWPC